MPDIINQLKNMKKNKQYVVNAFKRGSLKSNSSYQFYFHLKNKQINANT